MMSSQIEDEEKLTKYFLFTLMTEKKLPTIYIPDISFYKIGSVIGKGSFASTLIYAGQFIKTNELIAVKKYNLECISVSEIKLIQQEINLHSQITNNSYIVSYLMSFVNGFEVVSLISLVEYGSCLDLIRRHFQQGLPEQIINLIIKDVLKALLFIHTKGIIHRAIKGSHILISSDRHAKLSGFRYSFRKQYGNNLLSKMEKVYEFPPYSVSNLRWLSPDILEQNLNGYNEKSDIYSLGVTICELANGLVPYENRRLTSMLMDKINGNVPVIYDYVTLEKLFSEDDLDEDFYKMLKDRYSARKFSKHLHAVKNLCCTLKPQERPDSGLLLVHPMFATVGKSRKSFTELILPAVPITEKNFLTRNNGLEIPSAEKNFNTHGNLLDWEF